MSFRRFFVKISAIYGAVVFTYVQASCPSGWTETDHAQCLKNFGDGNLVNYIEAKAHCAAEGAHLPILSNSDSWADFDSLIASNANKLCWIGLSDEQEEGKFLWADGVELSWSNWFTGAGNLQPNDLSYLTGAADSTGTTADYVITYLNKWYDMHPTSSPDKYPVVCQKDNCATCTPGTSVMVPRDCAAIKKCTPSATSGVYQIKTTKGCGSDPTPCCRDVYCDMDTLGGGWTTIQARQGFIWGDPFNNMTWAAHEEGFGTVAANQPHWMGLGMIDELTNSNRYELLVELMYHEGSCFLYALYSSFRTDNSNGDYKLDIGPIGDNTAGDSLSLHNGAAYSTQDVDNDAVSWTNCAEYTHPRAPWWYGASCKRHAVLNGYLSQGGCSPYYHNGMTWYTARGYTYSFKQSWMKVRPAQLFHDPTANSTFCEESDLWFQPCPKDCHWAEWGPWSACSGNSATRTRSTTHVPELSGEGHPCSGYSLYNHGNTTETISCSSDNQPIIDGIILTSCARRLVMTSDSSCAALGTPPHPKNCAEIKLANPSATSGVYRVKLSETCHQLQICCPEVYCDMETWGGGWTIFLKRFDGSLSFAGAGRWNDYEIGFGSTSGEHWLGGETSGLEALNILSNQEENDLMYELKDHDKTCTRYGTISNFWIEHDGIWKFYRAQMNVTSETGNSLFGPDPGFTWHADKDFSTRGSMHGHACPLWGDSGGWWWGICARVYPTNPYKTGCENLSGYGRGITWANVRGLYYNFAGVEMKLRPASFPSNPTQNNFCTGDDLNFEPCSNDCVWSSWSPCIGSCSGGQCLRNRTIATPKSGYYSVGCWGPSSDMRPCGECQGSDYFMTLSNAIGASPNKTSFQILETTEVLCKTGYTPADVGRAISTCGLNEQWDPSPSHCVPIKQARDPTTKKEWKCQSFYNGIVNLCRFYFDD